MDQSSDRDPRTYAIIGAAMEVHRELGCGFIEVFFQDALEIEFQLRGIPFVREQAWHVFYKGRRLPSSLRPDFVCFGEVIVELKALTEITGREEAQILGYLKGTGFQTGLLLNFGTSSLFQKRFTHASKWLPEASSADEHKLKPSADFTDSNRISELNPSSALDNLR